MNKKEIIGFIRANKAITKVDEILARFNDLNSNDVNKQEIIEELEKNKVEMISALKIKLFKARTTDSLLKLASIINNENNHIKINNCIDDIIKKWRNDEL